MNDLDDNKVTEFLNSMSEKSDEEILKIFKVRHEYQKEASEAVVKIAMERGLINDKLEEIQKEVNRTDEWYYELNKQRIGAVTYSEICNLIRNKTLNQESIVWNKNYSDWKAIKFTELYEIIPSVEPPPLTGDKVNNFYIWLLAFTPIIASFIEGELIRTESAIIWFILNSGIAILDDWKLKRAGHKTDNLGWAIFIVPVYIWRRANLTKQSKNYFWIWILSLIISIFISASYFPAI